MAKGAKCDWTDCGKFVDIEGGPSGWLTLEVGEDWTAGSVTYDFCCMAHLRDWATARCQPASAHRGKR